MGGLRAGIVAIGVAIACFGIGLVVVGWRWVDDEYWSSVLANLGTTLLLAIPLVVVERALEGVVRAQKEFTKQLADLQTRTSRLVAERRAEDDSELVAPVRAIEKSPTYDSVANALDHADREGAIARWAHRGGPWVALRLAYPREKYVFSVTRKYSGGLHPLRLRKPTLILGVSALEKGSEGGHVLWVAEWSTEKVFAELDSMLRTNMGLSAPEVHPQVVLSGLVKALDYALRRRKAEGALTTWSLIGVVPEDWLVSTDGLEHVDNDVVVPVQDLRSNGADPPDALHDITDLDGFPLAWSLAQRWVASGTAQLERR